MVPVSWPDGHHLLGANESTSAMNVTSSPTLAGFGVAESAISVPAFPTVTTALLALPS